MINRKKFDSIVIADLYTFRWDMNEILVICIHRIIFVQNMQSRTITNEGNRNSLECVFAELSSNEIRWRQMRGAII